MSYCSYHNHKHFLCCQTDAKPPLTALEMMKAIIPFHCPQVEGQKNKQSVWGSGMTTTAFLNQDDHLLAEFIFAAKTVNNGDFACLLAVDNFNNAYVRPCPEWLQFLQKEGLWGLEHKVFYAAKYETSTNKKDHGNLLSKSHLGEAVFIQKPMKNIEHQYIRERVVGKTNAGNPLDVIASIPSSEKFDSLFKHDKYELEAPFEIEGQKAVAKIELSYYPGIQDQAQRLVVTNRDAAKHQYGSAIGLQAPISNLYVYNKFDFGSHKKDISRASEDPCYMSNTAGISFFERVGIYLPSKKNKYPQICDTFFKDQDSFKASPSVKVDIRCEFENPQASLHLIGGLTNLFHVESPPQKVLEAIAESISELPRP